MKEFKVPFNFPSVVGQEMKFIQESILLGQISGDGKFTRLASDFLTQIIGSEATLLTHSCTAALEMAALLCDLQPGDEVIMPSFTFVSTANAVVLRGAIPVFVDIDRNTLNLDPTEVEAAVTDKTRAIFAVHYAGITADMDQLSKISIKNNIFLIEDAAQALGSKYKGRAAGSLGDMAAFSFHETKNVISGEGGALAITRPEMITRAEIIRQKGTNRSEFQRGQVDKYTWLDVGSSYLPGELIAAFLYAQLLEERKIKEKRLQIFQTYANALSDLELSGLVKLPHIPEFCEGNGHIFYLLLKDSARRDDFINYMKRHHVSTPFHYIPLHSAPGGRHYGKAHGDLKVTNKASASLVRLPNYFSLGDDKLNFVIDKIYSFFR